MIKTTSHKHPLLILLTLILSMGLACGSAIANSGGLYGSNDFKTGRLSAQQMKAALDQELRTNPDNVQAYRDYADFLYEMGQSNTEVIRMLTRGFDHFVKKGNNAEGITRLGFLLAQHAKKYPATTKRTFATMVQATEGMQLNNEQQARVNFAKARLINAEGHKTSVASRF